MPISHPHKTIFVHIPKTAGTSVEAVLGMHGDKTDIGIVPYFDQINDDEHLYGKQMQHMTAAQIREVVKSRGIFSDYFKFTIVRNPWDRLVSMFAWTDQKWFKGEELLRSDFEKLVQDSYALFRAAKSSPKAIELPAYLRRQYDYIFDNCNRKLVDFVARYENLDFDWRIICIKLRLEVSLPHRMKSHHQNYKHYYGRETQRLVSEMFALDLEEFQYEF